jgi:hypothetical protein
MYPLGSLAAELQSASRRLLDVFEVPCSKATGERRTQGMRNGLESIGRLTHMKSLTDIPRLEAIVIAPKATELGQASIRQNRASLTALGQET